MILEGRTNKEEKILKLLEEMMTLEIKIGDLKEINRNNPIITAQILALKLKLSLKEFEIFLLSDGDTFEKTNTRKRDLN